MGGGGGGARASDKLTEMVVVETFQQIDVSISTDDIEDCHWLGKSNKITIVCFLSRKNYEASLSKKFDLNGKLDNALLVFISKNSSPCNQHLARMCRVLKRADKIHCCWSAKEIVRLRRTMNERPIAVNQRGEIAKLYSNVVFIERARSG